MKRPKNNNNIQSSGNVYSEYGAESSLEQIIDFFWSFRLKPVRKKTANINFLPSHYTSIIFVIKNRRVSAAFFHGPTLKRKVIRTKEPVHIFAANLTPFAALRFFKLNFNELVNGSLGFKAAAGKNIYLKLVSNIESCKTDNDLINVFTEFLISQKENSMSVDEEVARLGKLITNSQSENKLDEYYKQFSSTKRQLQRKFKKIMSLTPKEFARLVRIQHAGSELVKSGFKHFDVLYKYGYYDQSHYIKEFKSIMGSSPKDFEFSQKKIEYKFIDD